ncbi:MAG: tRNA pseudouridine(55) synthase TruB [Acidobacteriota bacterium]
MRDGLLLIDKSDGPTSHDVVAACRKILRQKKIGHCGTLDPAATGLLLLTVGKATRLTRFLIRAGKVYAGVARFGVVTDTWDTTGVVEEEKPVDGLDLDQVRRVMESMHGDGMQMPPRYSAKKVGGKKHYERARAGEPVPDDKKPVTIYELAPTVDSWDPHDGLPFVLSCTSGTYARSVVHEIGQELGCGGALESLRRTHIGKLSLDDAITVDELRRRIDGDEEIGAGWIPFDEIPLPFGVVAADAQQERRIAHGQSVLFRDLDGREGDWMKIINRRHELIAVGSVIERIGTGNVGVVQPKVVFQ